MGRVPEAMLTDATAGTQRSTRSQHLPPWLWFASAGAALLYGVPSVWMTLSFIQQTYDLGIFDQTVWLIANGETFNTVAGYHVMGDHFSPVLYAISPLAFVPGGPVPELIFQALLLGSGVFPAYLLARRLDRDPRWFVMVYAIHPAMVTGAWTGWRPWNLAVSAFMWACYLVVSKPTVPRIAASGLVLLLFREDMAAWVGLLVLIVFLARRISLADLIKGWTIIGAGTLLVLFVVLPALSPMDGYFFAGDFTSDTAPGVGEVIGSVSTRIAFLFLPLAIAPAKFEWRLVAPLGLPIVGLLLRGGPSLTTFFQYDMMFVPLLLVVMGLSTKVEFKPRLLVSASLVALVAFGALRPIPPQHGSNPWLYDSALAGDYSDALSVVNQLSDFDSLSVTAPDTLLPHLSERRNVFLYPFPVDKIRDPENIDSRLSYDCPPSTVIVAPDSFLTEPWIETMASVGYDKISTHGRVSVWLAQEPQPLEPCTAHYS